MTLKKKIVVAIGFISAGLAHASGWNPETRTYDYTGYWNQLTAGTSSAPSFSHPGHWRPAGSSTPAQSFSSEACLKATGTIYVNPDGDGVTKFPCSVLAITTGQSLFYTGNQYFDFGNQVDMLSGANMSTYAAAFKASGTFNFYSTEQSPNFIKIAAGTTLDSQGYFLKDVTMTGDSLAYVILGGYSSSCKLASFKWESGDGSNFHGTLRISNSPAAAGCVTKFKVADINIGGTVSLSNDTQFVLCGNSGATVSNLVMDAGSLIVGTTASRKLTICGRAAYAEKFSIDVKDLSAPSDDVSVTWEIAKFAKTADLSGFDCKDVNLVNAAASVVKYGVLKLRSDADGGSTLLLLKPRIVTRTDVPSNPYRSATADNSGFRSELQFAKSSTTDKDFWSDGSCPNVGGLEDVAYVSDYSLVFPSNMTSEIPEFTGCSLELHGRQMETAAWTPGCRIPMLKFVDRCGIRLLDKAGYRDPEFMNEDGVVHATVRLQGGLDLGTSSTVTHWIEIYEKQIFLRIESVVSGAGNLVLQTYPSLDWQNLNATLELVADNSEWTGKLMVKGLNSEQYKEYTVDGKTVLFPNRQNCGHCRLYLSNALGLGGHRAQYAYDALSLKHYGEIFLRQSVTLPAGLNRGVFFGDYSTLSITNGLTLTVLQPTTWSGTVYKAGTGRLALGCVPKFNGGSQSDMPTEGENVLVVEGGSVKPLISEAFNGVSIRLANADSRIELDADATGDLAERGLVNVKTDLPFAADAADGKIRFSVKTQASDEAVAAGFTASLCTVSKTAAVALRGKITADKLFGIRGVVGDSENADGSVTFRAHYEKRGVVLIVR